MCIYKYIEICITFTRFFLYLRIGKCGWWMIFVWLSNVAMFVIYQEKQWKAKIKTKQQQINKIAFDYRIKSFQKKKTLQITSGTQAQKHSFFSRQSNITCKNQIVYMYIMLDDFTKLWWKSLHLNWNIRFAEHKI